jgi:hypothetical protein
MLHLSGSYFQYQRFLLFELCSTNGSNAELYQSELWCTNLKYMSAPESFLLHKHLNYAISVSLMLHFSEWCCTNLSYAVPICAALNQSWVCCTNLSKTVRIWVMPFQAEPSCINLSNIVAIIRSISIRLCDISKVCDTMYILCTSELSIWFTVNLLAVHVLDNPGCVI